MSDHDDRLLLPTRKIVSIDEARRVPPPGKAPGDERLVLNEPTKALLGKLTHRMGEQIYEQLGEETQKYLQEMELALLEAIDRRVEQVIFRRSLYGRFRTLLLRMGAKPKVTTPELVAEQASEPAEPAAVEAPADEEAKMRAAEDEALHTHAP